MQFRVSPGFVRDEFIVEAVDPLAGNDAALIAVYNTEASAQRLAKLFNFMNALYEQCESCQAK